MPDLKEVVPEPVNIGPGVPGVPASLPKSGDSHPYLSRSISLCKKVQKYSVLPFSCFSLVHIFSVVVTPAVFGPQTADDLISVGRELYHIPVVEVGIFASAALHVVSGVVGNLLTRYQNYVKYGRSGARRNSKKHKFETSMKVTGNAEDVEVKDINEGLGGISSVVGAGSRPSITSRMFGLSPLAFSGYVYLCLLLDHIFNERVAPVMVDGDSSMVDLSYVSYAMQQTFWKTFTGLNLLVVTATYHMAVGANRYLKRFKLKQRRRTYLTLVALAACGFVSLLRIRHVDVFTAAAKRFHLYLNPW